MPARHIQGSEPDVGPPGRASSWGRRDGATGSGCEQILDRPHGLYGAKRCENGMAQDVEFVDGIDKRHHGRQATYWLKFAARRV